MLHPEFFIGSLFAVASLVGAVGYALDRYNVTELKRMELSADAIEAEAWCKLSTRVILKSMNMETYMQKEHEYNSIIRDFHDAKTEFKTINRASPADANITSTVAIQQVLRRLGESPFLIDENRVELCAIQSMLSSSKKNVTCNDLAKTFPSFKLSNVFTNCRYSGASVNVEEAMDAFEYKL